MAIPSMISNIQPRGLDYWDTDHEFPVSLWKREVEKSRTRRGYWEWVKFRKYAASKSTDPLHISGSRKTWGSEFVRTPKTKESIHDQGKPEPTR